MSSNGPSAPAPVPSAGALPLAGSPPVADREALSDRVWTLPNALSVLRLLGVPLFLWLLLGPEADGGRSSSSLCPAPPTGSTASWPAG
jgi:cardiolipin synthase (CMP-forming)